MNVGDIVYFKNLIFDNKVIDHSFNIGRPCVYLGEKGDNMYFVSLTNVDTLKHNVVHVIKPDKENNLKKPSHANFKNIVEKPVGFYESDSYLSDEDTELLFKNIFKYITKIKRPSDKICLELARDYLGSLAPNNKKAK